MMQYLKLIIIILLNILLRIFHIFPINRNRIVFTSYYGQQYACNPKYIFEYIYKNYGDKYSYVWCLNNEKLFPNEFTKVKIVKYLSFKYILYLQSSKYCVANSHLVPFLNKRKEQIFINTWHGGGAYKKNGVDLKFYSKERKKSIKILLKIRAKQNPYIISSCKKFTDFSSKDWEIPISSFLPIGMPRNDIIFSKKIDLKNKIASQFCIDENLKIVLYAPTFRGNPQKTEDIDITLDTEKLLTAAKKRFKNDFVIFYRGHFLFNYNYIPEGLIDASSYPDMQELLCASDILITDYSSSMWDFSFTFKPCFIYAPDLKKYQSQQGFYTPIEEWPFPIAESNIELIKNILQFNEEKYMINVKKHHIDLGSFEYGTACEQFCRFIFSI